MSKINNINQLRARVLQSIEDLEEGKIEIDQAIAVSKLSDAVISSLKSEMQYAILTNSQPCIPFYGEQSGITLDNTCIKKLL